MEDSCTVSFFGYDRDIVHMNSELLRLHTQDIHRQDQASQTISMYMWGGGHKVTSLAEEQLASPGFTEQALIFLQGSFQ